MTFLMQLIEDDILVFGYVRLEIENKLNLEIPNEIKSLSYQFFKDKWDQTICSSSAIEIKQDAIIQYNEFKANGVGFVYGHKVVEPGEIAIWKLKLLKAGACFLNHRIKIGIIECLNDEIPKSEWDRGTEILLRKWNKGDLINYDSDPDNNASGISHKHQGRILGVNDYRSDGISYKIIMKAEDKYVAYLLPEISIKFDPFINGIIIKHIRRIGGNNHFEWKWTDDMVSNGGYRDLGNIIGDVITMTLDLNQHTLNFATNGSNIGFIRMNTSNHTKKYRLAVSFNIR